MRAKTRRQIGRNRKRSRAKQSWLTGWLRSKAASRRRYRLSIALILSLGTAAIAAFVILTRREATWGPLPALAQFDVQPVDSAPAAIYEEDLAVDGSGHLIPPEIATPPEVSEVAPALMQRVEASRARSARVADRQASLRRVYRERSAPLPEDRLPAMDAVDAEAEPFDLLGGDSETAETLRRVLEGSR